MLHKHTFTFTKLKILAVGFTATLFNQGTAFAQTASASGSATLTINPTITTTIQNGVIQTITSGGYTSSVSGESVLPSGLFYGGPLVVTPIFSSAGGASLGSVVSSLSINPGTVGVVPANSTFNRAAAQILTNSAAAGAASGRIEQNIESISALIKAGAGINGLD
jgi:hypothetical protein